MICPTAALWIEAVGVTDENRRDKVRGRTYRLALRHGCPDCGAGQWRGHAGARRRAGAVHGAARPLQGRGGRTAGP